MQKMTEEGREKLAKAGKIAGTLRKEVPSKLIAGAKFLEIADFVEGRTKELGGLPAFPVNISIDNIAAHYTPTADDSSVLRNGNLVKIDIGVHVDGYPADTAVSASVGKSEENEMLIEAAEAALKAAIDIAKPGCRLGAIGRAIQSEIEKRKFKPVANLTGHSMMQWVLHAGTSIHNVETPGAGTLLPGMLVAIEPFSTTGSGHVEEGGPSQIFRLVGSGGVRLPQARELIETAYESYKTLPFAGRWLPANKRFLLPMLVNQRCLHNYPILKEREGKVAQAEHTLLVGEKEVEVLTL